MSCLLEEQAHCSNSRKCSSKKKQECCKGENRVGPCVLDKSGGPPTCCSSMLLRECTNCAATAGCTEILNGRPYK